MFKPVVIALLLFICLGCNDDQLESMGSADCEYIHAIGLSLEPMRESILVNYSFFNLANSPIDPSPNPKLSCEPEEINILISSNGEDFQNIATLNQISGSYNIENLEDCDLITVKIEGKHPDLETVSATRTAIVGEIVLPQFIDNPLSMEDFTLANNADQFIYRSTSDNWYLSSLSNPSRGQLIFEDVFRTRWNPKENHKVAGVENILVPILPNANGSTSKYLVEYNLNTGTKEILHEIKDHMDFNNDVYSPELYWIHEFNYSLDEQSIYFMSNKNNGGSSIFDQKVYDNIWKLNLATKEIEKVTDFFPLEFDLVDFIEDPKSKGNFYISGGERDVPIEIDDNVYFVDQFDIHYYNSADKTITPIFVNEEKIEYLNIDPSGENLVFTTKTSGKHELRSLNISSQKQKQLTFSDTYRPLNKWSHINWISSNEFMTNVIQDGNLKFAKFKI